LHAIPAPLVACAQAALAAHARTGGPRVADIAVLIGLSERQLERRFRDANRVSPKRFASLLRFERALPQLDGGRSLARIAVDAVYADQSHFSREIARFSGLSPARLRQQRRRSFAQLDMSGSFKIK
jgi:AraC-like DNA-binding protein